jgi:hypothetical protein
METSSFQRVYSFKHFDTGRRLWIEVRRSTFTDPNWLAEARQQDGLVIASRTISPEKAASVWSRYGSRSEVTWLS